MLFFSAVAFRESVPEGPLLGLDVGSKTIGLAACDLARVIATPLHTVARRKWTDDLTALHNVVQERSITGCVAGYPLNMDGSAGPRAQSTRDVCKRLTAALHLPILLWDERMSTLAVERMMIEADLSRARRESVVDKLAAAYILQGALEALRTIG